jgi:hypothetical protein
MRKLTAHNNVRAPPHWNHVPTESHSDGQLARYFPKTMWKLLRSVGYGELLIFVRTPRLLQGTTYLWNVWVVMYEKLTTDRICCIHQVIKSAASRMSFEAGIRDAACQALATFHHEEDDQMEHS